MGTESYTGNSFPHVCEVHYGEYRFIPAPLIEWVEEYDHDPNDKSRTIKTTSIKLDGVFYRAGGSFEQMYEMQKSLRTAFSVDGYEFKIVAGDGNATLPSGTAIISGIYPQIKNVTIEPDLQFNKLDYTVDLYVTEASVSGLAVTDLSETWELKENSDGWYLDVSHSISAKGINTLASGTNAIHNAIAAVKPKLGLSSLPYYLPQYTEPSASGGAATGFFEIGVNRTEQVDPLGGSYSVTENFIIASGTNNYVHSQIGSFEESEDGIATVTLQGTIKGAGRTNYNLNGGVGFTYAKNGFINDVKPNLASNASGIYNAYKENYSDYYLFTTNPLSLSISENKYAGTIQYTVSYNDDPSENLPSGILEASSSTQKTYGIRLKTTHPIPFRRLGNIIQDIKTTTEGQYVVNASAKAKNTGDATVDTNRAIGYVQDEINRLRPVPADYITLRVGDLQQTYSDKELTAEASITYIFTVDLAVVPSPDTDITLLTL
jgi:hypothetical protein